ncbi:YiiX/YebB-like N1pC/P60 family cysteine hydrolase [Peribacillus muralis]|uniref:YiiX/YebB-like N1pC/P60 family cysteine hydrolase n=1 Tax=Peribacillus muralis TaxID=264697 RepID=UPI0036719B9A
MDKDLTYEEYFELLSEENSQQETLFKDEVDILTPDSDIEELEDYGLTTTKDNEALTTIEDKGNIVSNMTQTSPLHRTTFATAATSSTYYYPGSKIKPKAGDILITNSTSSSGFVGHAGIVVSSTNFVSIRNEKSHPKNLSLSTWFNWYDNTKIIRINDSDKAKKAANWAIEYAKDYPNADYKITTKLTGFDPTYCSKILWQSYANTGKVFTKTSIGIRAPYTFTMKSTYKGVTAKRIHLVGKKFGNGDL